jgi:hypothetical protein
VEAGWQAGDNLTALHADVAQLVEHNLAKVGVAGSNPVVRSTPLQAKFNRSKGSAG